MAGVRQQSTRDVRAAERDIDRPDTALDEQFTGFNKLEQTCKKCGKHYSVHANNAQSCLGHPGELQVDWQSAARNVSIGLLVGAGIGSVVGLLSWVVAKAVVAPVIMSPAPMPGLTTMALASQASGAGSGSATAAAAGASVGSLGMAASVMAPGAQAATAGAAVTPGVFVGAGASTAGAVGLTVKGVQSANDEVGFKPGSHRWSCCGYHQSEESCDGRLSMHLPKEIVQGEDDDDHVTRKCSCIGASS
eukprot:Hpha_TRINITY_DN15475_c0_g1::TRINITY_DN15475_c0_g1_i1::g.174711::m.174711